MNNYPHLKERIGVVPVAFDTTLAYGANLTKGFKNLLAASQYEEACLLFYINAWSATPAGESITIEVLESDTNVAAAYAAPSPAHSQVFGPTANGGGGETIGSGGVILRFHFKPGQFKDWIRFRITSDTTGGDETLDYTAVLLLGAAKVEPVTQPVASTVLVTPS